MSIATLTFFAFAATVALLWHWLRGARPRSLLFLTANLIFAGTMANTPSAYVPFGLYVACGFAAIRIRLHHQSKAVLILLVSVIVLAFCWLKRYWFLAAVGLPHFPIVTVGSSYVLFRILHMVIDVPGEPLIQNLKPPDYINYLLNFTTFIAGPIQRYEGFSRPASAVTATVVAESVERVIGGAFKLVVLGWIFIRIHDDARQRLFASSSMEGMIAASAVTIVAYPMFLYYNFSGYTDIVIAVARLIGLELPENFNHPFTALNFVDFWGRYHISLSGWLRDYVYSPLLRGLMTRFPEPGLDPLFGILALFATFFVMGLWHGPTVMFVLYGVLLALGASINKLYQVVVIAQLGRGKYRNLSARKWYRACARGLTFTWYVLSMICFWSNAAYARRFLSLLGVSGMLASTACIFAGVAGIFYVVERGGGAFVQRLMPKFGPEWPPFVRVNLAVLLAACCIVVEFEASGSIPDVVYKAF